MSFVALVLNSSRRANASCCLSLSDFKNIFVYVSAIASDRASCSASTYLGASAPKTFGSNISSSNIGYKVFSTLSDAPRIVSKILSILGLILNGGYCL